MAVLVLKQNKQSQVHIFQYTFESYMQTTVSVCMITMIGSSFFLIYVTVCLTFNLCYLSSYGAIFFTINYFHCIFFKSFTRYFQIFFTFVIIKFILVRIQCLLYEKIEKLHAVCLITFAVVCLILWYARTLDYFYPHYI